MLHLQNKWFKCIFRIVILPTAREGSIDVLSQTGTELISPVLVQTWHRCTVGGTAPVDSTVHRQPSVRCSGLLLGSLKTSAAGTSTLYSSPGMEKFYRVDTTHGNNLDEVNIRMEGHQVGYKEKQTKQQYKLVTNRKFMKISINTPGMIIISLTA